MRDLIKETENFINDVLVQASEKAALSGELPRDAAVSGSVFAASSPDRGDFSANHALRCAAKCAMPAGQLAETLVRYADKGEMPEAELRADPSGFINITLTDARYLRMLREYAAMGSPEPGVPLRRETPDAPCPESTEEAFGIETDENDGAELGRKEPGYVTAYARRRAENFLALCREKGIGTEIPEDRACCGELPREEKEFLLSLARCTSSDGESGDCGMKRAECAEKYLAFYRSEKIFSRSAIPAERLPAASIALLNVLNVLEIRTHD